MIWNQQRIPTPSPTSLANLSARHEEVPEFDDLVTKKCANQGYNQELPNKPHQNEPSQRIIGSSDCEQMIMRYNDIE